MERLESGPDTPEKFQLLIQLNQEREELLKGTKNFMVSFSSISLHVSNVRATLSVLHWILRGFLFRTFTNTV